jgi:hypothetical protein
MEPISIIKLLADYGVSGLKIQKLDKEKEENFRILANDQVTRWKMQSRMGGIVAQFK